MSELRLLENYSNEDDDVEPIGKQPFVATAERLDLCSCDIDQALDCMHSSGGMNSAPSVMFVGIPHLLD